MSEHDNSEIHKAVIAGIAVSLSAFDKNTLEPAYTITFKPFDGVGSEDPNYTKDVTYLRSLIYGRICSAEGMIRSNQVVTEPYPRIYFEYDYATDEVMQERLKKVMEAIDFVADRISDREHLAELRRHHEAVLISNQDQSLARYLAKNTNPIIAATLKLFRENEIYINEEVEEDVRATMHEVFLAATAQTEMPKAYIDAARLLLEEYMIELTPDVEEQVTERITRAHEESLGRK